MKDNLNKSSKSNNIKKSQCIYKVSILRIMLIFTITSAGMLSGGLSYSIIRNYQYKLYQQEFNNLVDDNFKSIQESLFIKLEMNIQVATIFGIACPSLKNWPYCVLSSEEFSDRTNSLVSVSQISQFATLPIVKPELKKDFENFALNYFKNDGGYPSETGISNFGSGIYRFDSNLNRIPTLNHSNIGNYDIFLPVLQVSNIEYGSSSILFDAHSDLAIGRTTENVLDCVNKMVKNQGFNLSYKADRTFIQKKCSLLTDFIPSFGLRSSVIGTPIFPINETDSNVVVGFAGSLFSWSSVLLSASRIDSTFQCVIQSSTSSVRLIYEVNNGIVTDDNFQKDSKKSYDHFDDRLKRSYILNNVDNLLSNETIYTITYYSTKDSPSKYLAILACSCCIGVTIVISLIFLFFNILIKREAVEANVLLDSKRIFVRFISHEIRTPLNTVILGLRVLQENLTTIRKKTDILEDLIEESLNIIDDLDENSSIAVTTLNDLINYDKIETKTFTIEKKMVNIWSTVEKTVSLLAPQAKEKGVNLTFNSQLLNPHNFLPSNIELTSLRVFGDSIKLGQVIRNLVSNALKFTPIDGHVEISVNYEPESLNFESPKKSYFSFNQMKFHSIAAISSEIVNERVGHILITVKDTGPGLSLEQLKSMFREGVQFNPNELQAGQGSGLGLWISREIVALHDGSISVTSNGLGQGSIFQVKLPVILRHGIEDLPSPSNILRKLELSLEPSYRKQNSISSSLVTATGTTTINKMTHHTLNNGNESLSDKKERYVLVVDDASSNRKIVCRILKSKGYICHEAENGLQCVEKVLSNDYQYEFIVLDYEMPILDGPSAARQLRDKKCDIIIIGVSGNVLPDDREYFLNQGANAVLPKPVNIDELLNRVKNFQIKA